MQPRPHDQQLSRPEVMKTQLKKLTHILKTSQSHNRIKSAHSVYENTE